MLRRIEPVTAVLVLLCAGWTIIARVQDLTYAEAGALRTRLLWEGEYHRLLTGAFLHHLTFWLHLGANALGLVLIGPLLAREAGRAFYLVALFASVLGGWTAGMLWYPPETWQMGISGGILGLIGALFAFEWAHAKSFKAFLRSRNTWVLVFVVGFGAVLTWHMNRLTAEKYNVVASQAGHAGGLVVGLLVGLAWFGRRGRRPLLGVVVAMLVGLAPVAYCAFPVYDAAFVLFRAERAYRAGDEGAAAAFYEQALRLDGAHPLAGARLALLRDDPGYLDGLRPPPDVETGDVVLQAHLDLATARLEPAPDVARSLADHAAELPYGNPARWFAFGDAAAQTGRTAIAQIAFVQATEWLRRGGRTSLAWGPASRTLGVYLQQLRGEDADFALCVDAVEAAATAAPGLVEEDVPEAQRRALEKAMRDVALAAAKVVTSLPDDHPHAHDLDAGLARLFRLLANNTTEPRLEAAYLYYAAGWTWRGAGGEATEEAQAAFRGVLSAAREHGDEKIEAEAVRWFENRGLPVPPPELARDDDDG